MCGGGGEERAREREAETERSRLGASDSRVGLWGGGQRASEREAETEREKAARKSQKKVTEHQLLFGDVTQPSPQ